MPTLRNQKDVQKEVLTVKDVAAALGLSTDRVYGLIAEGTLPSVRVGSKQGGVRVPRQAFEEHLHRLNEAARASVASPARTTRSLKDIFPKAAGGEEEGSTDRIAGLEGVAEQMRPLSDAIKRLLTPTPEQQAQLDQASAGFALYLRNSAPRR